MRGHGHRLRPEHMTGCQAEVKAGQDHKTTHAQTAAHNQQIYILIY